MPMPTKDSQIKGLEKLRLIAQTDPMKALDVFIGKVVKPQIKDCKLKKE